MSFNFASLAADIEAVFTHPAISANIPPEIQPQVDNIRSTIASAAASVTSDVATALPAAASHEVTVVLNHNHLAALAPLLSALVGALVQTAVPFPVAPKS